MLAKMDKRLKYGLVLGVILALIVATVALADNVKNDVVAGGNDTFTAGGSTTIFYWIQATGSNGCDASSSSPAVVNFTVPAGVTASLTQLTFTNCNTSGNEANPNNTQSITYTSSTAGDYLINATATGYNDSPADFTLHVLAPPPPSDTTGPVITPTVSGTLGNNGWYVSDVTVSWSVVDAESTVSSTTGCEPTTINNDTAGVTLTCSATSAGGTSSQSVTIKRDATAPTISGEASPAANGNGWNNTDVTVTFTCADNLSGVSSCGPNQTLSSEGAGQSVDGTAVDNAGNSVSTTVSGINIDKTAPTASASVSPDPNANGWNNTDVTVSFSGIDGLSGIDTCSNPVVFSSEGAGQSASGTCMDLAGNESEEATSSGINIDKTAPTFDACPTGGPFILNSGLQTVGPISVEASISGLNAGASTLSGSLDTSSVGEKSVTFTAVDHADNSDETSCSYSVTYNWSGFFAPIDNDLLNSAKAGQAIPVKWRLTDANGDPVSDPASFVEIKTTLSPTCTGSADAVETYAGSSGLQYLGDGYWQYNWKTPKSYTGQCRTMSLNLADGMHHTADFSFK